MGKDKHKKSQVCVCVCVCVCVVVVMVTALPARQGAQQPEHLAYPRGHPVASTLWDSAMGTRWASLEDFYYRGCQSSPSKHATMTRDIW